MAVFWQPYTRTHAHCDTSLFRLNQTQNLPANSNSLLHVFACMPTFANTHANTRNTTQYICDSMPVFCRITGPPMPLFCLFPFSSLLYRRRPCKTFTAFSLCVLHTVDNQNELAHAGNKERVNPSDLHHPFILEFCQYLLTSCTVLYPKNEWQLGKFLGKCMHTSK